MFISTGRAEPSRAGRKRRITRQLQSLFFLEQKLQSLLKPAWFGFISQSAHRPNLQRMSAQLYKIGPRVSSSLLLLPALAPLSLLPVAYDTAHLSKSSFTSSWSIRENITEGQMLSPMKSCAQVAWAVVSSIEQQQQ